MGSAVKKHKLFGIVPPMVTPFRDDGTIAEDALRAETRTLPRIRR